MRGKGYSSRISCTDSRNEGSGPAFRQMAVVGVGDVAERFLWHLLSVFLSSK